MKKVIVAADIWAEVFLAAEWYETRLDGLSADFLQSVLNTLDQISENPLLFPVIDSPIRRALTKRFPFGIFYEWDGETAIVISIVDLHRSQSQWKKRKRKH